MDGRAFLERSDCELARPTEVALRVDSVRAGEQEPAVLLFPQDRALGADEIGRDPADVRGGVSLVERGGKRLAHELEHGRPAGVEGAAVGCGEGTQHERDLTRRELGGEPFSVREVGPGPVELERSRGAVGSNGDEQDRAGGSPLRRMPRGVGRLGEAREGRLRHVGGRQVRALELRGERGRPGHGHRLETRTDGDPDEHEVGADDDPRRVGDIVQRLRERRPPRGGGECAGKDGQPVDRDARGLPIRLSDHPGEVSPPRACGRTIRRWHRPCPARTRLR